jgi:hypothetical protein
MSIYEYLQLMVWVLGLMTAPLVFTQSAVKKEFSVELGKRLLSLKIGEWLRNLPEEFINFFDAIFTKKHFSLLCFKRSCISSICFFIIVTITYFLSYPGSSFRISAERLIFNNSYKFNIGNLLIILTLNLFTDYISLLETRYVISKIDKKSSMIKIALLLCFDIIASATIFLTIGISLILLYWYLIDIIFDIFGYTGTYQAQVPFNNIFELFNFLKFNAYMLHNILPNPNVNGFTVIHFAYYTTFFSSIWLYLFSFTILIFKIFQKFGGSVWRYFFHHILDIEENPFIALSWIIGVFTLILFLFCMPFAVNI